MLNKQALMLFCLMMAGLNSCNTLKPFFIRNEKKELRKEKRTEKKIERKENKIEKKLDKVEELKSNLGKIDSVAPPKRDSLVIKSTDQAAAQQLMQHKKIHYHTYQAKSKIHVEANETKQHLTANIRIQRDSSIWVSISASLIGEVARALITPDSVKAFERINKRTFLFKYSALEKLINLSVDFNTLQELLTGNAIATEGEVLEMRELGLLSSILIRGKDYTNQLTYLKSDSTLTQMQVQTSRPASSSSLLIRFTQFQLTESRWVPMNRRYHILDIKGAIELEMDLIKAEFDKPIETPFTLPRNYKLQD